MKHMTSPGCHRHRSRLTTSRLWWLCLVALSVVGCRNTGAIHPEAIRQTSIGADYLKQGQYTTAERHFSSAIDLDSRYAPAYYQLGVIAYERGLFRTAVKYFDQAVSRQRSLVSAWVYRGLAQRSQKQYRKAIQSFRQALKHKAKFFPARLGLLQTYRRVKEFEKARQEGRVLVASYPRRHEPHHELGMLYQLQSKPDAAINSYKRAIGLNPRAIPSHLQLSIIYLQKKRFCQAELHLRTILRINIKHVEARRLYGIARQGMQGINCNDRKIQP